jgi:hypothetical protein
LNFETSSITILSFVEQSNIASKSRGELWGWANCQKRTQIRLHWNPLQGIEDNNWRFG